MLSNIVLSTPLLAEFRAAGIAGEIDFTNDIIKNLQPVLANLERVAAEERGLRYIIAQQFNPRDTYRTGWLKLGIPEDDLQTVLDSVSQCAVLFALLNKPLQTFENDFGISRQHNAAAGLYSPYDDRLLEIANVRAVAKSIVTEFLPDNQMTAQEKLRLERIGVTIAAAGSPNYAKIMRLHDEYEAQATPNARLLSDIEHLEILMRAQLYQERYPELSSRLESLWTTVEKELKTEPGKDFFETLQNGKGPHPLTIDQPAQNGPN